MNTESERYVLAAWKLPLIVASLICSIVGGFYLGGAGLGLAVGALAASSVILWAVHDPPRPAIVPPVAQDGRIRLLLLIDGAVGAAAVAAAALAVAGAADAIEVFAVVPLRLGLVERWTSDTDNGRKLAEGRLAMAISAFERAGVPVSGTLGDDEPVQAAEDALRSYPATLVALLTTDPAAKADTLDERLGVPFVRLRPEDLPSQTPLLAPTPAPRSRGAAAL